MVPTHDTESAANDQNVLRLPMVQKTHLPPCRVNINIPTNATLFSDNFLL